MPNVTNQQAIKFCDEHIRLAANLAFIGDGAMNQLLEEWNDEQVGALIPDDPSALIMDSASGGPQGNQPIDGRPPITGRDVWNMIRAAQRFVTNIGATNADGSVDIQTATKIHVNDTL